MKITKRDVFVFILGMLTWMTLEIIYDWEGTKKSFNEADVFKNKGVRIDQQLMRSNYKYDVEKFMSEIHI